MINNSGGEKQEKAAMNLLITGGAGFIGSNLIQHVIDRPQVVKLVNLDCLTYAGRLENLTDVAKHPKYLFEKVDLRDKAGVLNIVQRHSITPSPSRAAFLTSISTIRAPPSKNSSP